MVAEHPRAMEAPEMAGLGEPGSQGQVSGSQAQKPGSRSRNTM
jgi:hypothetical protein